MDVNTMHEHACPTSSFGGYAGPYDGFGRSVLKNIGRAVKKAGTQTVHAAGSVASSKITKGILATGLAVTGVGVGASAAIMAGTGVVGGAAKKGGGLKKAVRGGAQGAVLGAGAGLVGKVLPKVPGVGGGVKRIRKAIGRAPVESGPNNGVVTSYDSDKRLDALASGPLPTVSTISGNTMAVLKAVPAVPVDDLTFSPMPAAEKARIRGNRGKQGLFDRIFNEKNRKAAENAVALATSVTTEPSANPSAPQGGFPATPATPFSPDNQNQDSETLKAGGTSPVVLLALAGAAFLAFNKKGRR